MSLITEIQTIITDLYPDSLQILSSKFQTNIQAYLTEASQLPLIIIDNELSKNSEIKKNNNVQKDSKILITILNIDSLDNTDAQTNDIVDLCEAMADLIAAKIYQIIAVRLKGNQTYKLTPMIHVFSSNMSGIALEMQVNYNLIVNF